MGLPRLFSYSTGQTPQKFVLYIKISQILLLYIKISQVIILYNTDSNVHYRNITSEIDFPNILKYIFKIFRVSPLHQQQHTPLSSTDRRYYVDYYVILLYKKNPLLYITGQLNFTP